MVDITWDRDSRRHIGEVVTLCGGDTGDEPIACQVYVETGTDETGETWYRWIEDDDSIGVVDHGDSTQDEDEAEDGASLRIDSDESECPDCGESRVEDGIDCGGNCCRMPRRCKCQRDARRADEDRNDDGEWAVVDMDGSVLSRHDSECGAAAAAAHDQDDFSAHLVQTRQSGSGAYIPRSVIHLPCGYERAGQYSTKWYSPGCPHRSGIVD